MLGVCNSETLEQLARVDAVVTRTQQMSSLHILTEVAIWSPEYARGAVADIDQERRTREARWRISLNVIFKGPEGVRGRFWAGLGTFFKGYKGFRRLFEGSWTFGSSLWVV